MLEGLRVVEFTQVIAGPFAGAILSDFGADVIKIEKANGGDDGRVTGPAYLNGDSLTFLELNRGKRSFAVDLKQAGSLENMHRLIGTADVFIHNQRPDVARKFGFDGQSMLAKFPRLIYCQISAFGSAGPLELAPGYESIVQSFSGLASINGFPENPPVRVGSSICDLGSGMWSVIGILAALRKRDQTGEGTIVNASLLETALSWCASSVNNYVNTGARPKRQGSGFTNMVPYQTFDAADASLVICAGNDRLFAKLADVLGHPEWLQDERYKTNRARLKNRAEIVGLISAILKTDTAQKWVALLSEAGVPCCLVQTIPEALAHPQVEEIDIVQAVPDQPLKLVALPLSFNGKRPKFKHVAPQLGDYNDEFAKASWRASSKT